MKRASCSGDGKQCTINLGLRYRRCECGRERVRKNAFISSAKDAFNRLPEEEKDHVFRDLYGVDDGIEENEEFIDDKLNDFDEAIRNVATDVKRSYLLALDEEEKQGTQYVRSKTFRLMFLRADSFKVSSAAIRMTSFFNEKMELFGVEKLPRRILQTDLDDDDKEALFSGSIYIDNDVECSNRTVLVWRRNRTVFRDVVNLRRANFYYILASIEDNDDAQKRGMVVINYGVDTSSASRKYEKKMRRHISSFAKSFHQALPLRLACYHDCCSKFMDHILISLLVHFVPLRARARGFQHFGSHTKCRSLLIMYGININRLPIRSNGEYKIEMLKSNLERRHLEESEGL